MSTRGSPASGNGDQRLGLLVMLLTSGGMAAAALTFPPRARMYPLFVGTLGVLLAAAELVRVHRASTRRGGDDAAMRDSSR